MGTAASLFISLLKGVLTTDHMNSFGWRIPFLSSFIVAIIGLYYQYKMPPSRGFAVAARENTMTGNPVLNALRIHWRMIILITLAVVPWCAGNYMTFTFLPIYLQSELGIENALLNSSI